MKDPIAELERSAPLAVGDTRLPVLPPFAALVEIAVVFAAILAIDWLQPGWELLSFRPHPFWLPVLLVSLQYGTVSGLLATAIAIGYTVFAGFPEQSPTQTYFAYLIKIWLEPILWISAAVVIGQFRMRQIGRKQQLAQHVAELTSQRSAIADYARNLRAHCNTLERQIAMRKEPDVLVALQTLDAAFRQGGSDGTPDLDRALASIIEAALPGAQASLYIVDAAGLTLATTSAAAPTIGATDPLYRSIVGEAQGASVLTRDGEASLSGHGMAAVPILALAHDTHVIGMLKIDRVDRAALGAALLPAMATLARALAPAIEARLHGAPVVATPAQPDGAAGMQAQATKFLRHLRWFSRLSPAAPVAGEITAHRPATTANH